MSSKIVATFLLWWLLNVIGGAIMEGTGGIAATSLTQPLTVAATTVSVRSTVGFLKAGEGKIESESFRYTSVTSTSFTGVTRGYNNTTAKAHNNGMKVYSPESGILNAALGYNVASTSTTIGGINFGVATLLFFTKTIPQVVSWDFSQWKGSQWQEVIRYVFAAISTGFVIYFAYIVLWALGGVAQRIFTSLTGAP
jgi:hypothetical protein